MKIAVLMTILEGDNDHFVNAINKVLPFADDVFVGINHYTQVGNGVHGDTTTKILQEVFENNDNVKWYDCDETDEYSQRNFLLDKIKEGGYSHCWIVDADEVWNPQMAAKLKDMVGHSLPIVDCWRCPMNTYWKTKDYVISPRESFVPLIMFRLHRHTNFDKSLRSPREVTNTNKHVLLRDVIMDHYSYVRNSDKSIKRKIDGFTHKVDMLPNWYEEVWKKWTPEMENLHPVNPVWYKKAVKK